MEILADFVGKVVQLTVVQISRQLAYLLFHRSYMDGLKEQVEKLKVTREVVQHSVDAARRNCEEIEDTVRNWMHKVDVMIEEEEKFCQKESSANTGCSHRSFPSPWLRHQISRKAKRMAREIHLLKEEGNFEKVSFQTLPQCIGPSSDVKKAFKSRILNLNEIMVALADPIVHGVGKTTLTKQVAKKAEEEKLFEMVVWVEVKHKPLKEIQSQIAYKLGFQFDQSEIEIVIPNRLHSRLEQEKSFLVLLDDLWERLDLEQVGNPLIDGRNKHCKIILTSRSEDLLFSQMNCKRNIKVGLLFDEEAWALFKEMAEVNDDFDDPDLLSVAIEVSKKCAQLPLAIVTVARALRNKKRLVEWRDALRRLKSSTSRNITGIREVDSSLRLSYDYLESKELKSTFLLSAMFSNDPLIADLFISSVGLGLLQDAHNLEEARDRFYTLVCKLKASSLLLDSHSKHHLTMHDVVRDLALSIAFEEQHALVLRDRKVNEWSYGDQLESCAAMCLYNSYIDMLPEELYARKVEFFSLIIKDPHLRIPSSFFKGMQELKVLNFTNMAFSSLPFSISLLNKLTTLSLQFCTLGDITVVKSLKKLKVLNLSSSRIIQLPSEMGQLSCLQMLNLSNCYQLVIPANILSKLKNLEELYMLGSFNQWEAEGLNEDKERASLVELKHLKKLSALEINIPDVSVLPKDLLVENSLERYRKSIGTFEVHFFGYASSRKLRLVLNNNMNMEYGVFRLLESVEDLHLENLVGITSLCQVRFTTQTFWKLRTIEVRCCDQLKSLFSMSMTRILSRLEEIIVSQCKSMEEIVTCIDKENIKKGSTMKVIEFLQLRSLTIEYLPELTEFCFRNKVFPKLEKLRLSGRQAQMMWNGKFQAYQFPNVKVLYLSGIYDKAATFPHGLFYGFPKLE